MKSPINMPNGTPFNFWDDVTEYTRVYHVDCRHAAASDHGPGTAEQPFATIGRAAATLQPCEKVLIHAGTYRECVRPQRGGTGPDGMIAYEAAPGERPRIRGSEEWSGPFEKSADWAPVRTPEGVTVWCGDLPVSWFVGYNPFLARNITSHFTTFVDNWAKKESQIFLLRRGMVFVDGHPLRQVLLPRGLNEGDGVFYVEDTGLRLHMRLPGDADPRGLRLEIAAREQVFAPALPGLGYIRVFGLTFEHAADGFPVPQRAMLSAGRGHHWIVEKNVFRYANACAIDVGKETWDRPNLPEAGGHIVRRNHISHCGICGIAAVENNAGTLLEDNIIEYIGTQHSERLWETGGIKLHLCDSVLIRGNICRHLLAAPGLWLDYLNRNCRVTGNVFTDIESLHGGVYLEVSHDLNVLDHNVVWDIRGPAPGTGHGFDIDTGESCVVAHNFIGRIRDGYGVSAHRLQKERVVAGRSGLGVRHKVLNNIFVECPMRILLATTEENTADGNLYDLRDGGSLFRIEGPSPCADPDFAAWRDRYGFDAHGTECEIEAGFDIQRSELSVRVNGVLPGCGPVAELHGDDTAAATVGPCALEGGAVRRVFPVG